MTLHNEIYDQPQVLADLLHSQAATVKQIAAAVRAHGINQIFLAARGTSANAGVYAQYIFGAFNRLSVALAAPSLFTVYQRPPRLDNTLVIGISQSGQAPDVLKVLEEGVSQGALTLAITNDPNSPMAQTAKFTLAISAGAEKAVAATKTYTATLFSLAMLSAALSEDAQQAAELQAVPQAISAVLEREPQITQLIQPFTTMERCVVLGRGYNFATALEWALKLKELTYVVAEPYSTAEFQHGPIALVEQGFPVLAVAPQDAGSAEINQLLKLLESRGAQLITLSDNPEIATLHLPLNLAPWLTPIATIVPAQLFCYHLTIARGNDPQLPRGLSKVTLTH